MIFLHWDIKTDTGNLMYFFASGTVDEKKTSPVKVSVDLALL